MNETADPGFATATSGFAVLRTRLPYVDRRVLSEAWFSALHLAHDPANALPAPAFAAAASGREVAPARERPASPPPGAGVAPRTNVAPISRAPARTGELGAGLPERADPAGRRERTAVAPAAPGGRVRAYLERGTSLTVGVAGSRVQLLLRRQGAVLHVVALCRPQVAETVGRALAGADLALRLRCDRVRGSVCVATDEVRA